MSTTTKTKGTTAGASFVAPGAVSHAIGKSTLYGIAANFAQLATRLVTVPIVVSHVGLDGYGIWSIIMTAAAYMRFGSVGIKSAFQKYVAEATGTGDFERANKLISTGSAAMLVISVVGLIPVSIFSRAIAHCAGVPAQFEASTAGAISLLALIMLLSNSGAAFEAIVMGAHRIDLVRKFNIASTVLEAIAILVLLRLGYGLLAMAYVMAFSEIAYLTYCYVESRRVLPVVRIRPHYISRSVAWELVTFGGSYQLLSLLEVLYGAILPLTVLKFFGASAAGVYAIATRLVTAALLPQEALLQPILSAGSMIFASGRPEQIQQLLAKAFKSSLILAMLPLAFVSAFGSTIVLAWTGEASPLFRLAIVSVGAAGLFKSLSLLELVFYRASGNSILDNIRQVLRIALLLVIGAFGTRLGFQGILAGLAATELAGMIYMYFAVSATFGGISLKRLASDVLKVVMAGCVITAVGALVINIQLPWAFQLRTLATIQTSAVCLTTLVALYPTLILTRCLSKDEVQTVMAMFRKKINASV
jgi:O-antigen/teichoic acid export membrane protein